MRTAEDLGEKVDAAVAADGLYVYERAGRTAGADATVRPPLVRSTVYTFRALVGLALTIVGFVTLVLFENAALGLREDFLAVQEPVPDWLVRGIAEALSLVFLIAVAGINVYLLWRHKYRRLIMINLAAFVTMVLVGIASGIVLEVATSDALVEVIESDDEAMFNNVGLASLIAVLTVSSVWIGPRLRPWVIGLTGLTAGISFFWSALAITTLPLDLGIGMLAGALVALVIKTRDRTPMASELAATLEQNRIPIARVERAAVDARGSVPWFATTTDGDELFVKTLSSDQRAADLLFRMYRVLRVRRPGNKQTFSSLRRAVEHEAFLSLAAESRGIRTPHLVAVAEIGTDGMLLAYRRLEGTSLDSVDAGDITDAMLADVWRLVAQLRDGAIAHRDLRLANVFIATDGKPWLIDFGFAELAADHTLLARDVAELMASTSAVVGPDRAVAVAIDEMGSDAVADALPWIQPLALSSATHSQLGSRDDYARLHAVASAALGLDEVRYEKLDRVSRNTILTMASVALALYVVIPQITTAAGFIDEVADIDLGWVALAVLVSLLPYIGAAASVAGPIPVRLAFPPIVLVQLAGVYSSRWPTTSLGEGSLTKRFLQKQNLTGSMTEDAGRLMYVAESATYWTLTAAAAVAAGRLPDMPDISTSATIVITLVMLAALVVALPAGRRLLIRRLQRFQESWALTASLAKTPAKLFTLYAGVGVVLVGFTAAMLSSLEAAGADLPVATSAFVFLLAAGLASNVPTPGAIGATEAALFAGFVIVQVPATTALVAVLLFRLITFWLPILPGWLARRALQRSGRL